MQLFDVGMNSIEYEQRSGNANVLTAKMHELGAECFTRMDELVALIRNPQ